MKLSARNQIKGKIIAIKNGAVNGMVIMDIGGDKQITSTISMDAIQALNLKVGADAIAVIKATSIMIGIPD